MGRQIKMKIGIFGGSFNPPHLGHLNAVSSVIKKMGLDKILIVPTFQNPLKTEELTSEASPENRLKMAQKAFQSLGTNFEVLPIEIERQGPSYTIETLKQVRDLYPKAQLFLIIGADNFISFDKWKDWKKILNQSDLIVTTRPGWDIPFNHEGLPESFRSLISSFEFNVAELKEGGQIHFLTLRDVAISSTEIRRLLQIGKSTAQHLTLDVENYIRDNDVYPLLTEKVDDYERLTKECCEWMLDRKAINVRAFDLSQIEALGDYALICSGTSTKHVSSIAEYIKQEIKKKYNILPQATEGMNEGKWVVLDYGILIIHVFYEYVRQAYSLEKLWTGALEVKLESNSLEKNN